jgi:hypothetical protein
MKLKIKILFLILALLFMVQEVRSLAIVQPIPSDVVLKRGESLPIKFEIQAINSRVDQLCTYSISELKPLIVRFDEEEAIVKAGNFLNVFGTLEVPLHAPTKQYEGKLTISCKPNIVTLGGSLIVDTTEFPILVKVIKSEKETSDKYYFSALIFVGIIVVIFVWSKFR